MLATDWTMVHRTYGLLVTGLCHISLALYEAPQGTSNSRFTTLFFAISRFTTLFFREFTFTPLYLDFTIHATFFVNSRFTIEKVADSRFTTIKNPIHDHDHILIHDSRPKKSQIHDSRP